jgi:hypothetical protein
MPPLSALIVNPPRSASTLPLRDSLRLPLHSTAPKQPMKMPPTPFWSVNDVWPKKARRVEPLPPVVKLASAPVAIASPGPTATRR